jgi:hypothetical protein
MALRRAGECVRDDFPHRFVKPHSLLFQQRFGFPMELSNLVSRRLRELATGQNFTEEVEIIFADFLRSATARIVGQPVRISREHEMCCEDHAPRRISAFAKGQAVIGASLRI